MKLTKLNSALPCNRCVSLLFQKEQIDVFVGDAEQHKQNISTQEEDNTAEDAKPIDMCNTEEANEFDDMLDDLLGEKGENNADKILDPDVPNIESSQRTDTDTSEQADSDGLDDLLAGSSDKNQVEDVENDLDMLLNDTEDKSSNQVQNCNGDDIKQAVVTDDKVKLPKAAHTNTEALTNTNMVKPKNIDLEDELDSLLDLDQPSKPNTTASKDTGGALDDWLDSMLED